MSEDRYCCPCGIPTRGPGEYCPNCEPPEKHVVCLACDAETHDTCICDRDYERTRIAEIRSRLNMAHAGPWRTDTKIGPWTFVRNVDNVEVAHAAKWGGSDSGPLVANARDDIEWLLARVGA